MNKLYARLSLSMASLLLFSTFVFAGPLDDYYLQQFGEAKSIELQKAILSVTADVQESAQCGMPLKHGLRRDWKLLEQSTRKVLAKQLAAPVLSGTTSGTEPTLVSPSGRFKIHYTTTGVDAAPSIAWVQTVAKTFDDVATSYIALGWQLAPTAGNSPYDIYLRDLAPQRLYGLTTSDAPAASAGKPNAFTSWLELDNNFTEFLYTNASGGPYTPLQSLQITAAHEYHHAIQYGYNFYFDVWYAEATSTWMEGELYDGVNQNYIYISNWFTRSNLSLDIPASTTTGGGYGRWILNRYLSEKHGPAMIRAVWEKLAPLNPATSTLNSDGDIIMAPVLDSVLTASFDSTLSTEFTGFAKRVYTRDWTTHQAEIALIPDYAPTASYSSYPVNSASIAKPSVTLPHYSFAYYRFSLPSGAPRNLTLTVTGSSGIKATSFIKNSAGAITEFPFSSVNSASVTIPGFSTTSEVVLLIANSTGEDNHTANFSTDGSIAGVTEPPTPTPTPAPTPVTSSSGGNGCFIATAAYGSYLHPHVQLLRNFRDEHLLTNAPGRAFVALYYRCSPPLADFIARHPFLRGVTRLFLTPLVVAVAHPLITAISLFLIIGAILVSLRRRFKAGRPNSCYIMHSTSSRS